MGRSYTVRLSSLSQLASKQSEVKELAKLGTVLGFSSIIMTSGPNIGNPLKPEFLGNTTDINIPETVLFGNNSRKL